MASDEDMEPVSASVKALCNELVLEIVFKDMGVRDLMSVRLVCTLWRQVSIPMWHAAAGINVSTVVTNCGGDCCCKCCCECSPYLSLDKDQPKDAELHGDIIKCPYRRLSVELVCLEGYDEDYYGELRKRTRLSMLTRNTFVCQKVLWMGASKLTELTLINHFFDTCNDFVKIVTNWLPHLQSLKLINAVFGYICENDKDGEWVHGVNTFHTKLTKMEISLCDKPQSRYGQHTLGWRYFLQPFPNLTKLTITSRRLKGIGVDVLEDLRKLREGYAAGWKLQRLLILGNCTEMTYKSAQCFQSLELPLDTLSLEFTDSTTPSSMTSIFSSCAPTLHSLSLTLHPDFACLPKIPQTLHTLSKLHLVYKGNSPKLFRKCVANLSECFPNLTTLLVETKGSAKVMRGVVSETFPPVPTLLVGVLEEEGPLKTDHFGVMTGAASVSTSILSCVICVRVPPMKILQCRMGHLVCQECTLTGKVKQCPKCQTLYEGRDIKALSAETMLTFSRFLCPFNPEGCKEVLCRRQNHEHTSTCNYRAIKLSKLLGYNVHVECLERRPAEYHGTTDTTRDNAEDKLRFLRNFNEQLIWKWSRLMSASEVNFMV